jgi:uncharacterized protein YacL
MLRWPLVQIVGLIVTLLIMSFLSVPILSVVLEPVRLLMMMVLGVALAYLGVLLRDRSSQPQTVVVEPPRERVR